MAGGGYSLGKAIGSDIPLEHLDSSYIETCKNAEELEKIIKILRSGVEGRYPHLEISAEKRLYDLKPNSDIFLREKSSPPVTSDDMQGILDDLETWKNSLSAQEQCLVNGFGAQDETLPPVRASNVAIGRIPQPVENMEDSAKVTPSVTLDHSEMDGLAEKEKLKGNEAFRSGDYLEAVEYYSKSIDLKPSLQAYNNRALAYLKLKMFKQALSDCEQVLKISPTDTKGLYRKACAYDGLGQLSEAKECLEVVLAGEPGNKKAIELLENLNHKICKQQEKQMQNAKRKGKKVVIKEIDGAKGTSPVPPRVEQAWGTSPDLDTPPKMDQHVDTPPKMDQHVNTPPKMDQHVDTPPKMDQHVDTPPKMDQHVDTPPKLDQHVDTPPKSDQHVDTPPKVDKHVDTPPKVDQHMDTPAKVDQHVDTPPKVDKHVDTPSCPVPEEVGKLKTEGNNYYKQGQFSKAVEFYTSALAQLQPDSEKHRSIVCTLLTNRAAGWLKIGNCRECIEDCTESIRLQSDNVRAHVRRAEAYETLEKYVDAIGDYEQALRIVPHIDQIRNAANRVKATLVALHGPQWKTITTTNIPETSVPEKPETSVPEEPETSVPEESEMSVPEEPETSIPEETETSVPEESETSVPEESETSVPEETETSVPEEPETSVPKEPETSVPEESETSVPEETEMSVPEEPETSVPEEPETSVPEEPETSVPEEPETSVPEEPETSAPEEQETLIPEEPETSVPEEPETSLSETATPNISESQTSRTNKVGVKTSEDIFEEFRVKGNSLVRVSEFEKALHCYSQCIKNCPANATGYTNRALCFLKLNRPGLAEEDCVKALEIDKKNVKALYRRALARKGLKKYSESAKDLCQLLQMDPGNAAAKGELEVVKDLWRKDLKAPRHTSQAADSSAASRRSSRKRNKAKKKKIVIEEVTSTEPALQSTLAGGNETGDISTSKASLRDTFTGEKFTRDTFPSDTSPRDTSTRDTSSIVTVPRESFLMETSAGDTSPRDTSAGDTSPRDTSAGDTPPRDTSADDTSPRDTSAGDTPPRDTTIIEKFNEALSPYVFLHTWNSIPRLSPPSRYAELLNNINIQQLPNIVSNKLDGEMLVSIISAAQYLLMAGQPDTAYNVLLYASHCERFGTVAMFLSKQERAVCKEVITKLHNTRKAQDIQELVTIYKIN